MPEEKFFILQVNPVIDHSMIELCKRPYPDHAKGCPNYGKKETCPPHTKMFYEVFNAAYPVFAIVNAFDLKSHMEALKTKHPNWSERQLASSRFWQGKARKKLNEKINKFLQDHKDYGVTSCPEGLGVNVTETLKNVGIRMEWPPRNIAYQVALAAKKIP